MKPGASSRREDDPNKKAEGRKENTNRTYFIINLFEAFRSTTQEGAMCD